MSAVEFYNRCSTELFKIIIEQIKLVNVNQLKGKRKRKQKEKKSKTKTKKETKTQTLHLKFRLDSIYIYKFILCYWFWIKRHYRISILLISIYLCYIFWWFMYFDFRLCVCIRWWVKQCFENFVVEWKIVVVFNEIKTKIGFSNHKVSIIMKECKINMYLHRTKIFHLKIEIRKLHTFQFNIELKYIWAMTANFLFSYLNHFLLIWFYWNSDQSFNFLFFYIKMLY